MNKENISHNTVFLIDGSGFLYRAYYSMRPLHTSKGVTVQAVYGFCRMLKKLIDKYKPEHMVLVWDSKGKTERHEIFPEYKSTRQAPPSDLFEQKKLILEFAHKIGLHQLEQSGLEADDLIYSAAKELSEKDYTVAIVSSDKDLYQLLSEKIYIIDPFKDITVTKEKHETNLGYPISKIPFYFALLGDASDNIPGVKGIGKKGAEDLVKEFESLEDLYNNLDRVTKEKTRQALIESRDNAFLSYKLFLLRYHLLNLSYEYTKFDAANWNNALDFFKELEFKSLIEDIAKKTDTVIEEAKIPFYEKKSMDFKTIQTKEDLESLIQELKTCECFAIDTEGEGLDPFDNKSVGISVCTKLGTAYYVPYGHITTETQLEESYVVGQLKPILENPDIKKVLQHAKFDALVLNRLGIKLNGIIFDTLIAANLVTPDWQRIGLDKLSKFYLDDEMLDYNDVVKKNKYKNFAYVPLDLATKYSASDAHQTLALKPILEQELVKKNLEKLFYEIEMPLSKALITMEIEGISLNTQILHNIEIKIETEINDIQEKIKALIGETHEINLKSPKQIEELLFVKLNLPPIKKSEKKTGYSTDQSVLVELSKIHPVPGLILRLRELNKLQSTYVQALPKYISKFDNKIHTSFSQTATATGRLASSDPNLQNIPADSSYYAQQIRASFIPPEGYIFVSADYSQIELRVLAYLSQDKNLIDAFLAGHDIHAITTSKLFDVELDKVTSEQRQVGKRINFSILYGLTPYGLSQDLKIPFSDAKKYIEKYFAQYPDVQKWMNSVIEKTKELGYVQTHWGRIRYIPGIHERNKFLYEFARRAAINTVAQGTAAEIMKIGMINLDKIFKSQKLDTKIILQIHDELLISCPSTEIEKTSKIVKENLEKVVNWNVPLEVNIKIGKNWQEVSK